MYCTETISTCYIEILTQTQAVVANCMEFCPERQACLMYSGLCAVLLYRSMGSEILLTFTDTLGGQLHNCSLSSLW